MRLRATAVFFGTEPVVTSSVGSALVQQGLAMVEAAITPWPGWMRPVGTLGIGAYYVGVHGQGVSPVRGADDSAAAVAYSLGLGVTSSITSACDAAFEIQTLLTTPGLTVRFLTEDAANIGRPSFLGVLTIAGWQ
jgi:hypothetical protein